MGKEREEGEGGDTGYHQATVGVVFETEDHFGSSSRCSPSNLTYLQVLQIYSRERGRYRVRGERERERGKGKERTRNSLEGSIILQGKYHPNKDCRTMQSHFYNT